MEGDLSRQWVHDSDTVGDTLPHGGAQVNGADDAWGSGLEVDIVEEVLVGLLIAEGHLREGGEGRGGEGRGGEGRGGEQV